MAAIRTCREAVFEAFARLEHRTGRGSFRLGEIVAEAQAITDRYSEHTIRSEVVSVMGADAPVHHANHTNDLARVSRGWYRRITPSPGEGEAGPGAEGRVAEMTHTAELTDMGRLILVGCVKEKGPNVAAAKDLYVSPLWRKRRRYAEASGQPWFILSAKYGLLHPDTRIEPYDVSLAGASPADSARWAHRVLPQIVGVASALGMGRVEIHAGQQYMPPELRVGLAEARIEVQHPLAGLRVGEQLQWYDETAAASAVPQPPARETGPERPTHGPADDRIPTEAQTAVSQRLLAWGASEEIARPPEVAVFVPNNVPAETFVRDNPFAFLLAVIFDQGITAERAWEAPWLLKERLGHLDPYRVRGEVDLVRAAVSQPPALHRYVNNVPAWVVAAAEQVVRLYQGEASLIWADQPTAAQLQRRFEAFAGIGPKKAAMAVEILCKYFGVEVQDLTGTNLAYDVHVRRVFLRSGLAEWDDQAHMLQAARRLNPARPGALDGPAWAIGREFCHPSDPDCPACPLTDLCPKLTSRGDAVRGA